MDNNGENRTPQYNFIGMERPSESNIVKNKI